MTVLIDRQDSRPVAECCGRHENRPDALLEILHEVQARRGWLSDGALREIAKTLNISLAEIHGVASFYHDFKRKPPASHCVKICKAEACQAAGCDDLAQHVEKEFSVGGALRAEFGDVDV